MPRKMHFVAFLITGPTSHHNGMWRHPETDNRFLLPEFWESLARTLEAGRFDAFFFADALALSNDTALRRGGQMALLDPLPLAAMMARVTSRLGIGITLSTSFSAPYGLARVLATLDLLSGGRVAWNVVTSALNAEAEMFGMPELPPRDRRYERAEEVLEACFAMWRSWGDGALVADKDSGVFIDPVKLPALSYRGNQVAMKGRFPVPPSPQRHPVIMQAGSSPRGRQFAAQWAEMIFTLQHSLADMQAFYTDMKTRMESQGRDRGQCAILTAVDPIIGETESIAREKQQYINDKVDIELGLAHALAHTGIDFSRYPLHRPLSEITIGEDGTRGVLDVLLRGVEAENLTLGDAVRRLAISELCPQVVGTAESVADQLQVMFEAEGCDGFIVTPTQMPGSFESFVRSVVPILQKRGLFRSDYEGSTLRDTLGLAR